MRFLPRKSFFALATLFLFFAFPVFSFAAPFINGSADATFTDTKFGTVRFVVSGSDAQTAGTQVADVSTSGLTGYAFGSHVGWITLSDPNGSDYGVDVTCNSGIATLSGYAFGQTAGFINFGPFVNSATQQVQIDASGNFSGYAWAQKAGWLDFSGVQTSFHCTTPPGGGGGGGSNGDPDATCTLTTTPSTIAPGQSATLVWDTNFGNNTLDAGSITPTIGSVSSESGSVVVSPLATTQYHGTFTSSDTDGTANCYATLNVALPQASSIRFDPIAYQVQEGNTATLTVRRNGDASAFASAVVQTQNGNATAPSDYTATNQIITWQAGDASPKTVSVTTVSDLNAEGSEAFSAHIVAATGTAIETSYDTALVTIYESVIPPPQTTLILYKSVHNTYGGTALASDFIFKLNGQTVNQSVPIVITAGTQYSISEAGPSGYQFNAITGTAECPTALNQNFSVASGSTVLCTIHNYDTCSGSSCPQQNICLDPQATNYQGVLPCAYDSQNPNDPTSCIGDNCSTEPLSTNSANSQAVQTGLTALSLIGIALGILALTQALLSGIGSLTEFFARLGNILFGLFVPLRRKPWGIVYDSITKEPLDPVIVIVRDLLGNEIAQATSDIHGRFGFLLKPGSYTMSAQKTHYAFPSRIVHGSTDSGYESLYYGGTFTIEQNAKAVLFNIPMDPLDRDWNQDEKRRMHLFKKQRLLFAIDKVTRFFFPVGFASSLAAVIINPAWFNVLIFVLYILNLVMLIKGVEPKSYGSVMTPDGKLAQAARVSLYSAHTNTLIARRVTNEFGQYYMLVAPGVYYSTVELLTTEGAYEKVYTSEPMHLRRGIYSKIIRL